MFLEGFFKGNFVKGDSCKCDTGRNSHQYVLSLRPARRMGGMDEGVLSVKMTIKILPPYHPDCADQKSRRIRRFRFV